MRPDIDAGPIGRKCRPSNGPPPAIDALELDGCDCAIRWLSARGVNAAPSAARRMRTRTCFMADSAARAARASNPAWRTVEVRAARGARRLYWLLAAG